MLKKEVLNLSTFYSLYCDLCKNADITPSRAANAIGFNRATVTTWKNTGNTPKGDLLIKIAKYFDVPIDFLLGLQPFNNWDVINANRKQLIDASSIDSKLLSTLWGIDSNSPETASLVAFIKFVNEAIVSAEMNSDGVLEIKVNESFIGVTVGAQLRLGKKRPTPVSGDGLDPELVALIKRIPADRMPEVERYLRFQAEQGEKP